PYIFEDDSNGHAFMVTAESYVAMLNEFLLPELCRHHYILIVLYLSSCDYFLWRYLKHKVYENRPHMIYKLWDFIRTTILQIPVDRLRTLRRRAEDCLQNSGAHLTDVIFKKSYDMLFYRLHKSVFLILTEDKLPNSQI
ncbi:hypothetical protein B7P43_G00021, partial [Cryptotermes secundus]